MAKTEIVYGLRIFSRGRAKNILSPQTISVLEYFLEARQKIF